MPKTCLEIMVILFSETESEFQKQSPFLILDFTRKCRERGIQYVVRETKIATTVLNRKIVGVTGDGVFAKANAPFKNKM